MAETSSIPTAPGVDVALHGQRQEVFTVSVSRQLHHLLVAETLDQLRRLQWENRGRKCTIWLVIVCILQRFFIILKTQVGHA